MKKFVKVLAAAVLASACLATSASAYLDMGDSVNYSVKSNSRTWDNKNNTWAWDLLNDSPCVFKGDSYIWMLRLLCTLSVDIQPR